MIGQPAPDLTRPTDPGEVLRAAGAWLDGPLAAWGFRWMPEERSPAGDFPLRRERGGRIEQIELWHSSFSLLGVRHNGAGRRLRLGMSMSVRDRDLGAWRRSRHPRLVEIMGDRVVGHPVCWVAAAAGEIDLSDPARRLDALAGAVEAIGDHVLPWFDATGEPELLARTAPVVTLRSSAYAIIDWLAFRGRRDLIGVLLDRVLTTYPEERSVYQRGWQRAMDGVDVTDIRLNELVGWTAARFGDPGYLPPAGAAPATSAVSGAPVDALRPLRKPDGTPLTVVVTGRIEGRVRSRIDPMVERLGGRPADSMSPDTDLVITGDRVNAKVVRTATAWGVAVMSSQQFLGLYYAHNARDPDWMARVLAAVLTEAD